MIQGASTGAPHAASEVKVISGAPLRHRVQSGGGTMAGERVKIPVKKRGGDQAEVKNGN